MNPARTLLKQAEEALQSGRLNSARLAFEQARQQARHPHEIAFVAYQMGAFYWGEVGDGLAARRCFEETVSNWKRAVVETSGKFNPQVPLVANAAENLMILSLSFDEFDRWTEELRREAPHEPILHELVPQFHKAREAGEPWSSLMLSYALNYINPGAVAGAGAAGSGACLFQLLIENRVPLRLPLQKWRAAVLGYVTATSSVLGRADDLILKRTGRRQPGELQFARENGIRYLNEYCTQNPGDQELEKLRRIVDEPMRATASQATAPPTSVNPVASPPTGGFGPRVPTANEHFRFALLCLAIGAWPFFTGATLWWKVLGGIALGLGGLGLLAGATVRGGRSILGSMPGSFLDLAQLDADYKTFSEGCPRLGLRVVAIECDPFANATLVIRPTTTPDDPEALTSIVKARLFTLMPAALSDAKHLRLQMHPTACMISCRGRSFPEPSWFVSDGQVTVGPLGFRHPNWDEAEKVFQFTLMETSFTSAQLTEHMTSVGGSKASIVYDVATLYRDRLGEFSL